MLCIIDFLTALMADKKLIIITLSICLSMF
jgi:hypothetical protein